MATDFDQFLTEKRRPAASAFVRGDASRVVELSAQQGQATFFDPSGGFTEGAEAIIDANQRSVAYFGPRGSTELDLKDHGESGDLAFWTGFQEAQMDMNGAIHPMKLRVTEVFRRENDEWRLIHRHASKAESH